LGFDKLRFFYHLNKSLSLNETRLQLTLKAFRVIYLIEHLSNPSLKVGKFHLSASISCLAFVLIFEFLDAIPNLDRGRSLVLNLS
jgi:hypothetical protein